MKVFLLLLAATVCSGVSSSALFGDEIRKIDSELKDAKETLKDLGKDGYQTANEFDNDANSFLNEDERMDFDGYDAKRSLDDETQTYQCNFENPCKDDFTITGDNSFKWTLAKYQRRIVEIRDSSVTGGSFMLATITDRNQDRKKTTTFSTKEFTINTPEQCASFRYYMYNREGCDVVRLAVTLECGGKEETLFQDSGSQGNDWKEVRFSIKKPVLTKCKFHWKASKGLNVGQLAVDNIEMYYSACPASDVALPSTLDCGFQSGLCSWKSIGDIEWKFSSHGTQSQFTGPRMPVDIRNTRDSNMQGRYIYVDASLPNFNKRAILQSPKTISNTPKCMQVMINMNGKDIADLHILVNTQVKVKVSGDQGENWFVKRIDLPVDQEFQVAFHADTGRGPRGDISIDNILVTDGNCPKNNPILSECSLETGAENNCSYSPNPGCNSVVEKDTINTTEVTAIRVKYDQCMNKYFWVALNLPANVTTNQGACFEFEYKLNEGRACRLYMEQIEKTSKRIHRINPSRYDVYEGKLWVKYKAKLPFPIFYGQSYDLKIKSRINWSCKDLSIANIRLVSGTC